MNIFVLQRSRFIEYLVPINRTKSSLMGNVQGSFGSQIHPTVSYVQDVESLRYNRSLGETRFMKTACVESKDGISVVKLFVLNENFELLEPYINQVNHIRKKLKDAQNCLAFTRTFSTERCIILHRPYKKHTLYDRLSTRPFLLDIEKKWIAFQLLKALSQCRMHSTCHGDIKTQNVLISSSNWVQLSDFAPYKPAFVPYDNPSTFTFFFDTSRRRTSYLAPERFKKAEDLNYLPGRSDEFINISEGLTEAMDIFSMGCVLVELLTDGRHVAFNLSQGIDYTRMDERVANNYLQKLLSVCPEEFRKLLSIMLDRNEIKRKENFEKYLPCSSDLFPEIFETFFYRYFKDLLAVRKPDEIILKLFVEFDNYKQIFEKGEKDAIVLIIGIVTANLRSCQSMNTKMDAIALLQKLSAMCDPVLTADRVIPYLVALLNDYYSQVRAEAVFAITEILDNFSYVPDDETRLLVDYVFPRLKPLSERDTSESVKIALASCLGRLAVISLRFFNEASVKLNSDVGALSELHGTNQPDEETINRIIDSERTALQAAINDIFMDLCSKSDLAKQSLFSVDNFRLLCEFFGSKKTDENMLLHTMTLPNSKSDWELRATFFECYPIVARNLNPVVISKLIPFTQQALQDSEEFVTFHTLSCLRQLFDSNLLEKSIIFTLLPDVVLFLIHPNKWLRMQAVSILSLLDSILSVADVYCKLVPLVSKFLTEPLIRLNDKEVVLSCLVDPVPRQIWDLFVGCEHIDSLLHTIEKQQTIDKLGGGRHSLFSAGTSPDSVPHILGRIDPTHSLVADVVIEPIIRKLKNLGMNEQIESQLLSARSLLKKLNMTKRGETVSTTKLNAQPVLSAKPNLKKMLFDLENGVHRPVRPANESSKDLSYGSVPETSKFRIEIPFEEAVKLKMPLAEAFAHKQLRFQEQKHVTNPASLAAPRDQNDAGSIPVQQPNVMIASMATRSALNTFFTQSRPTPSAVVRRPELRLVSHLHEHNEAIIQLAVQPHKERFASCSADNTVKLWSASQSHLRDNPAIISLSTLEFQERTNSLAFMQGNDAHLAMGRGSELVVHDIDGNRLLRSFSVDKETDGFVSKVSTSDHLIYALTHHSGVYCFDLRASSNQKNQFMLEPVFLQRTRNSYGLATGFSVDFINQYWMLLTTSSSTTKNIVLWDLRFAGLEVASWSHPSKYVTPFRSWSYTADNLNCNHVFTNSAREGELSLWNLGTQDRTDVLWPGSEQPLTYTNELVTTALVSCPQMDGIFTGDSEGSLRYWNMSGHAERSNYLCGPYRKFANCWTSADVVGKSAKLDDRKSLSRVEYYISKRSDYPMQIHVEKRSASNLSDFEIQMVPHVSDAHRNSISDMVSVGNDQLVSADRAGIIKIWKTYVA
ncbi:Non-specific serine/threonine protein kinase [Aphelenchoides bicaudatus]|nr:Non-specific serine/threonine protein kinase [Aphelenchoides bicaudatus]